MPHDKAAIAAAHCIGDYWNYELDHYIPLCLGGPHDESNLVFQPWSAAINKDTLESAICRAACDSFITQEKAIKIIEHVWPRSMVR